jgi:hypothetical protein
MELWPTVEQMDRAARKRHAGQGSGLGAAPYLDGRRTAPIPTWFVHGNNEHFELLVRSADAPVDPAGRIVFLVPGSVREFRQGGEILRVAGLGGMEYRFGKHPRPSDEPIQKYLDPALLERLVREKPAVDVLLLHEAPMNKGLRNKFPTGSRRVGDLIGALEPRFAFFGHYDDPPDPFSLGPTLCAGMNLARARRLPGGEGAMGILRTDSWEFRFVKD